MEIALPLSWIEKTPELSLTLCFVSVPRGPSARIVIFARTSTPGSQAAPPRLQIYCARLLGFGLEQGRAFYETEYEFLPVLSELFVYGAVGRKPWLRILASCEDFLRALAATRGDSSGDLALRALAAFWVWRLA